MRCVVRSTGSCVELQTATPTYLWCSLSRMGTATGLVGPPSSAGLSVGIGVDDAAETLPGLQVGSGGPSHDSLRSVSNEAGAGLAAPERASRLMPPSSGMGQDQIVDGNVERAARRDRQNRSPVHTGQVICLNDDADLISCVYPFPRYCRA